MLPNSNLAAKQSQVGSKPVVRANLDDSMISDGTKFLPGTGSNSITQLTGEDQEAMAGLIRREIFKQNQ